jgi:hypothetical protein
MIQKKKPSQWAIQRSVRRCPLVASAEVTDLYSGMRLSARISELGVGGCYVDALTPFPEGTLIKLRIIRDEGVFESNGKVVYTHSNCGMGVAFTNVTSDQRSILEAWIRSIVASKGSTQFSPSRLNDPSHSSQRRGCWSSREELITTFAVTMIGSKSSVRHRS